MALPRITQKEMTEREQRELKTLLDRARQQLDATRLADTARRAVRVATTLATLAQARKGTHDAAKFRVPDADEIAMATALDNGKTLLTLAPEAVPADTPVLRIGEPR